jgi:thymidylate kinase
LLDRSFYSTLAYQGSALPPRQRRALETLQHRATIVPDRVVLLTLPLRLSEARMSRRGGERAPTERFEVLRRASRVYRRLAKQCGWIVLDARRHPEELVARLDRRLTRWVLRQTVLARERA